MVDSNSLMQSRPASRSEKPHHPTYIAIHSRCNSASVLYVSGGIREALGYTPSQIITKPALAFIADEFQNDYMLIYSRNSGNCEGDDSDEDGADVHSFYLNTTHADGHVLLERVTTIKCSNCVIAVITAYPEITGQNQKELEVEMIDRKMKRVNITREKKARLERQKKVGKPFIQPSMDRVRSKQIKAAFILERADVASLETAETGRRPAGPLVAFCTGSVSHLIEADTSDVMNYPFLKLVAPESIAYVSDFFDRLLDSNSVMFDTFALLKHPRIIDGDIFVGDEENPRIIVECLGAAADDGIALLLRCLRVEPAPRRNTMGNYIQSTPLEIDKGSGYQTLADIISSDAETSAAPDEWSQLP
ncbi:hypothetical protein IWW55_000725 [Coemansia sp. RSA 2706]|nr:hypothetical protein IWW55_000725 [Coemansia sp. RSA 2706]KAJ2313896.1 hypothetical protein IWW54_001240 [Coemansia sp. RSA 2705]KAJ2738284.1 hypothetical protein H4R23_001254 [Coemansia sp. Cherry 401B]